MKRLPRWRPDRFAFRRYLSFQKAVSWRYFDRYALPMTKAPEALPSPPKKESYVNGLQRAVLRNALETTENLGGSIVEIGAWRGSTTAFLAQTTKRQVYAVDDLLNKEPVLMAFKDATCGLTNVVHLRQTSGEAARE